MAITGRGKGWEIRNSIWMLWAILSFGFLNYVSFYYASYRVKQRKWFFAALIYSFIFIMTIVVIEVFPEEHWMTDVAIATFLLGWVFSIVHVFKIRTEYLLRLEATITTGQKEREIQSLKEQITREYGGTAEAAPKTAAVPRAMEQKSEEKIDIVDINTASEEEIAKVPGIGALFAKKVLEARSRENGFASLDHFVEVLSIKPHLAEKMKPYLAFPEKTQTSSLEKTEGRIVDF